MWKIIIFKNLPAAGKPLILCLCVVKFLDVRPIHYRLYISFPIKLYTFTECPSQTKQNLERATRYFIAGVLLVYLVIKGGNTQSSQVKVLGVNFMKHLHLKQANQQIYLSPLIREIIVRVVFRKWLPGQLEEFCFKKKL